MFNNASVYFRQSFSPMSVQTNLIFTMFFCQHLLSSLFYYRWQWRETFWSWQYSWSLEEDSELCVNTIPYCSQWISVLGFFTRLCSQPFHAAASFVCLANPGVPGDKAKLVTDLKTTSEGSSIFFLALTVLLMTLMSVERWLHMSTRRSFFTSCRGYSVMIVLLFIPISTVVFRVLENESRKYKYYRGFAISAPSFTC